MTAPQQGPGFRQSLTVRFLGRALPVALAVGCCLAGMQATLIASSERDHAARLLEAALDVAAPALAEAGGAAGSAAPARAGTLALRSSGVAQAEVRDDSGRVVWSGGERRPASGATGILLAGTDLEIARHVPAAAGGTALELKVSADLAALQRRVGDLVFAPMMAALGGCLLLAFLLAWLVSRGILRPLNALGDAVSRLPDPAGVGAQATLPVPQAHLQSEIGLLAQRVSAAIGALSTSYAALRDIVRTDQLTGLPNRLCMAEALDRAIERARKTDEQVALLYLDLDRFKQINDSLGHATGDKLLQQVAARLRELVPEPEGIARMGGDEFLILRERVDDRARVIRLAEGVLSVLSRPFQINGHAVHIGSSVGISVWPRDGSDAEEMIRSADTAMYAAKSAGAGTWRFFSREMRERALLWLRTEGSLRGALEQGHLEVFYQPKLKATTRKLYGMEALLRWRMQDRYVSPAEFIPIAEDTGLIIPIGEFVLRTACLQAAHWGRLHGPLQIAINVSARQLSLAEFPAVVRGVLDETGLPAERLTLEITESMLVDNVDSALDALRVLRDIGVGVAVDDFGTGYSSLSYLRQLPITQLKIDRSFVKDLPQDTAIAETVITLATKLGLQSVAEGVETEEQLAWLAAAGCDLLQGYHIAVPLPMKAFEQQFLPTGVLRLIGGTDGAA